MAYIAANRGSCEFVSDHVLSKCPALVCLFVLGFRLGAITARTISRRALPIFAASPGTPEK
jgi:hypothetical protein